MLNESFEKVSRNRLKRFIINNSQKSKVQQLTADIMAHRNGISIGDWYCFSVKPNTFFNKNKSLKNKITYVTIGRILSFKCHETKKQVDSVSTTVSLLRGKQTVG